MSTAAAAGTSAAPSAVVSGLGSEAAAERTPVSAAAAQETPVAAPAAEKSLAAPPGYNDALRAPPITPQQLAQSAQQPGQQATPRTHQDADVEMRSPTSTLTPLHPSVLDDYDEDSDDPDAPHFVYQNPADGVDFAWVDTECAALIMHQGVSKTYMVHPLAFESAPDKPERIPIDRAPAGRLRDQGEMPDRCAEELQRVDGPAFDTRSVTSDSSGADGVRVSVWQPHSVRDCQELLARASREPPDGVYRGRFNYLRRKHASPRVLPVAAVREWFARQDPLSQRPRHKDTAFPAVDWPVEAWHWWHEKRRRDRGFPDPGLHLVNGEISWTAIATLRDLRLLVKSVSNSGGLATLEDKVGAAARWLADATGFPDGDDHFVACHLPPSSPFNKENLRRHAKTCGFTKASAARFEEFANHLGPVT